MENTFCSNSICFRRKLFYVFLNSFLKQSFMRRMKEHTYFLQKKVNLFWNRGKCKYWLEHEKLFFSDISFSQLWPCEERVIKAKKKTRHERQKKHKVSIINNKLFFIFSLCWTCKVRVYEVEGTLLKIYHGSFLWC